MTFLGVRKTETRIPGTLQAADLGQAVVAPDGRCALVSFVTAPLAAGRENVYVVFVTDASLASSVASYQWSCVEDPGGTSNQTTDFGELTFTPPAEGYLTVTVTLLDSGTTELATLSLTQQVGPLNADLEELILQANNNPGPGMSNPDVLRELVNDHDPYYRQVPLPGPESPDAFNDFLFSTVFDGVLQRDPTKRSRELDQLAASLNAGDGDFASASSPGLGVAGVRLVLAAMLLPPNSVPYTELPSTSADNAVADEQVREKLAALTESDLIDWFNRARFPKTNILLCGQVLQALRDKFFVGVSFADVTTKMSGTMADWIMLNYNKGPLPRT